MTGYLPIGFEFASELTYPEPEGTTSGLLNASAQLFGIVFMTVASELDTRFGDMVSNLTLASFMVVGTILTGKHRAILRNYLTIVNEERCLLFLKVKFVSVFGTCSRCHCCCRYCCCCHGCCIILCTMFLEYKFAFSKTKCPLSASCESDLRRQRAFGALVEPGTGSP